MTQSKVVWSIGGLVALALFLVPYLMLPGAEEAPGQDPVERLDADVDDRAIARTDDPAASEGEGSSDGTVAEGLSDEGPAEPPAPSAADRWGRENETFDGSTASTERILAITEKEAAPSEPWEAFDGRPVKVFDIDGDGKKEIIAQNDNHWVYVFDSEDGTLLAELEQTVPSYWKARSFNGPEAGVLERGGEVHIVAADSAAVVSAWRFDAAESTADEFVFDQVWEMRLDECHEEPAMDAKVVLADLDLDGDLEILAATEEMGLYALTHDGKEYWTNCMSGGNAAPVVADVTADGWPDVVHVSDGGVISLLNGRTGNWTWAYGLADDYDLGSGSMPVAAGVGDLRGGPELEIVVGARDNHDPQDWDDNTAMLLALDHRGNVLWDFQHVGGNPLTYTTPLLVDADGDGETEIYWADWNTVGRTSENESDVAMWNRTGPANFFRLDPEGELVWNRTLATWWNNKDLRIADLTGDGSMELLANGPDGRGSDGMWYLDVRTGDKVAWIDLSPWKAQRAPVIADLYGDGTTQWVIEVGSNSPGTGPAILVYDAKVPYDAAWPHVPYPTLDEPFDVRFHDIRGDGHWVSVQAQQMGDRIERVEVRVDGGEWRPMEDAGWGWTRAERIGDDAVVQFRAVGARGDVVLSQCVVWPEATVTDCPEGVERKG